LAFSVSPPLVPVQDAPLGGAGGGELAVTETVADWLMLPPAPVQVSTYCDVELSAPVDSEPLVDTEPLQDPVAVHAVAFVELQLNMAA